MKTRFPLFVRLLGWFFLNVTLLVAALWVTLRIEFGSQFSGFLPETSRSQTQAMAVVLIDDLAKTPRDRWDDVLARLGTAYRMDFALFDGTANRLAGVAMDPPAEVRSTILMTAHARPAGAARGENEGPPDGPPPPGPDAPGPPGMLPRGSLGRPPLLPDFPQRVIRTDDPRTFWLLVHLPMDRLQLPGVKPAMLVGRTFRLEGSPLLFNPKPWLALAAGMILFSALFWLPLARNLTRSLARMTRVTEAIAEGNFDLHAPERRPDELGRLGFAINRMAARLKGFVTGQRRFLGDVAHELCSPLARMELALAILEERSDERSASYVRDVREEVTHMRRLAHELLSFSKASLGQNKIKLEPMNVAAAIESVVHQEHCAPGVVEIQAPGQLTLQAHPELICRALANLVRNAMRYAGGNGPITIKAWQENLEIVIAVADAGPGVPADEIQKLFDPFYRLDESRGFETGGIGLGLAIVKTCVEACKGTVTAFNRDPRGLEVQLRFPR